MLKLGFKFATPCNKLETWILLILRTDVVNKELCICLFKFQTYNQWNQYACSM